MALMTDVDNLGRWVNETLKVKVVVLSTVVLILKIPGRIECLSLDSWLCILPSDSQVYNNIVVLTHVQG